MFLLPALAQGLDLEVEGSLTDDWLCNSDQVMGVVGEWWGLSRIDIRSEVVRSGERAIRQKVAQCFTGGLDSLYAALYEVKKSDVFMYVPDFDPVRGGGEKQEENISHVRRCSDFLGREVCVIRSDLRSHPLYTGLAWEYLHGSALASTAMLLSSGIGSLLVPSSFASGHLQPWGSHPALDHLWSKRGVLEVVHADASLARIAKIRRIISDHPDVLKLLRVCAVAPVGKINCSMCRKCVRAMIMFRILRADHLATSFDWSIALEDRLGVLPKLPEWGMETWLDTADKADSEGFHQLGVAIRQLVRRSRWANWLAVPEKRFRAFRKKLIR